MRKQLELETSLFLSELESSAKKQKDPNFFNFTTVLSMAAAVMGILVLFTSFMGSDIYTGITLILTIIAGMSFLAQVLRVPKPTEYRVLNDGKKVVYNKKTATYVLAKEETKPRGRPIRIGTSKYDKKIFGLAGGIANYFGVDSGLIRALMVISIFITNGLSIPAYILLSAILGTEKYPDEK
ncbi:MAG: PspC domain-containing protein [Bacteroidia bacterium]|nr:PspC domain-containing protein [Bacteroidia bacterium]